MMRPGSLRTNSFLHAKNAACGPPYPSGTPNRCALPTAMSAPSSPGGTSSVSASRSHAMATIAPAACARSTKARQSSMRPSVAGYCTMAPKTLLAGEVEPLRVGDDHLDVVGRRTRAHDVNRLRMALVAHEQGAPALRRP